MARWFAVLTAIIGSGAWSALEAQDTVGIYFSSRGFAFDPFYRKAILTNDSAYLAGKAVFLLRLGDSLAHAWRAEGLVGVNLNRLPAAAEYVRSPHTLPPTWRALVLVQRLELKAQPLQAVYARSNRILTDAAYTLQARIEGICFTQGNAHPFRQEYPLNNPGWFASLRNYLQKLLCH
ncbi:MAG: hypothetical protein NZ958_03915 [Bacteroidia bacterium]|nr:hypothetical protein [Bacteroidia bacterium]MDW8088365.1 hypothetical protein [Bacteroidia bacterium]